MGRERSRFLCSTLTERVQGAQAGLTDCTPHTPVTLAPQSSACLTACLASPGINGVQKSRRTQKILYYSLKKFAFLFKAVQFYFSLFGLVGDIRLKVELEKV